MISNELINRVSCLTKPSIEVDNEIEWELFNRYLPLLTPKYTDSFYQVDKLTGENSYTISKMHPSLYKASIKAGHLYFEGDGFFAHTALLVAYLKLEQYVRDEFDILLKM